MLAQSSTPHLETSATMGKIAAACVIAIIVVFVIKKLRRK